MFIDCELGHVKSCAFKGESKGIFYCGIAKGDTNKISEMKKCPLHKSDDKDKKK